VNAVEAEDAVGLGQAAVGVEVVEAATLFQAQGFDPAGVRLYPYNSNHITAMET
jgi:hypothetical protein